jgi:hypothetical protein
MVCVCHRDAWAEVSPLLTWTDNQVVAREEEESTSPTPELGGRRISPTRYDLGIHGQESSSRKQTGYGDEPLSSSGESPESRGRGRAPGGIQSRSSSQGSRFQEHGIWEAAKQSFSRIISRSMHGHVAIFLFCIIDVYEFFGVKRADLFGVLRDR